MRWNAQQPEKYWFNTKTGRVEYGRQSLQLDRIGPFDTEAEAANALQHIQERSAAWAAQDAEED